MNGVRALVGLLGLLILVVGGAMMLYEANQTVPHLLGLAAAGAAAWWGLGGKGYQTR